MVLWEWSGNKQGRNTQSQLNSKRLNLEVPKSVTINEPTSIVNSPKKMDGATHSISSPLNVLENTTSQAMKNVVTKFINKDLKREYNTTDNAGGSSPLREDIRQKVAVVNLLRKTKRIVQEETEDEPLLPLKESDELLNEIHEKILKIDAQDFMLERAHKKNKISWK